MTQQTYIKTTTDKNCRCYNILAPACDSTYYPNFR